MKNLILMAAMCLCACGVNTGGDPGGDDGLGQNSEPVMSNVSPCQLHADATSCRADTADQCSWYPNTRPCQLGQSCPAGWCSGPATSVGDGGIGSGGGGSTDAGSVSGGAGCACPNGGVCYEQVGGPAQQSGSSPTIVCKAPTASCNAADVCQCFTRAYGGSDFSCYASPTVQGLCVCDNGMR